MKTPRYKRVLTRKAAAAWQQMEKQAARLQKAEDVNPGCKFLRVGIKHFGRLVSDETRALAYAGQGQ